MKSTQEVKISLCNELMMVKEDKVKPFAKLSEKQQKF